jgi:hypothetical protein
METLPNGSAYLHAGPERGEEEMITVTVPERNVDQYLYERTKQ